MTGVRRGLLPLFASALLGLSLCGLAALSLCGCANDLARSGGRYVDTKHGFAFAAPEPGEPPWRPARVERTLAAYTRPGGTQMSVQSECGRRPPSPQVQARSLLIGVGTRVLRQSGPVAVQATEGWSQILDVEEGSRVLRLKTVTLVTQDCTVDFMLIAGDDFESAEPGFDRWWASFEVLPSQQGAGS
jgi:hypothetical protein